MGIFSSDTGVEITIYLPNITDVDIYDSLPNYTLLTNSDIKRNIPSHCEVIWFICFHHYNTKQRGGKQREI